MRDILSLPSLRQHSVLQLDRNNEFKKVLHMILDYYEQISKSPNALRIDDNRSLFYEDVRQPSYSSRCRYRLSD